MSEIECRQCRQRKPLELFARDRSRPNGYRERCLECHKNDMRRIRAKRPERHILSIMVQRCHNDRHPKFHLYGGRGIAVDPTWRGKGGFARFFEHIGPRISPKHSVDRIKNDLGYQPGNVRWATQREQMANTRVARKILVRGEEKCIAEAQRIGGHKQVANRLAKGWPETAAVETPARPRRRLITHDGVTLDCHAWSRRLGGGAALVGSRLHNGWTEEEAVTTPLGMTRGWRTKGAA